MVGDTRLLNEALRQTRLFRGWSLEETAEQIRHLAFRLGEPEPGVDGNMISRWERGLHGPGPRYVRLLSLLLDEAPADLGLPSPTSGPLPGRASETYELARHASVSEVDTAALDDLDRAVDRLSREYSTSPPAALLTAVQQRLWHIDHLLGKRLTLDQHRRLLDSAGWLHVLKILGAALLKGRPETCGQACPGPFVRRFAGCLPCERGNQLIGVARCPPSGRPTCALAEDLVRIL
jgi:transcriptional regulator with XRE-family HTH domain